MKSQSEKAIIKKKNLNKTAREAKFYEKRKLDLEMIFNQAVGDNSIAPVIKQMAAVRILKGLTVNDMATFCDMHVANYKKIERGEVLPTVATLIRMAYALGGRIEFTGWMERKQK